MDRPQFYKETPQPTGEGSDNLGQQAPTLWPQTQSPEAPERGWNLEPGRDNGADSEKSRMGVYSEELKPQRGRQRNPLPGVPRRRKGEREGGNTVPSGSDDHNAETRRAKDKTRVRVLRSPIRRVCDSQVGRREQ